MFRELQRVRDNLVTLQRTVNAAILADTTREMSTLGTDGMAMIDETLQALRRARDTHDAGEPNVDPRFVTAASHALSLAWNAVEALGGGTSVDEMRAALVHTKTYVDVAGAYTAAALGIEFAE